MLEIFHFVNAVIGARDILVHILVHFLVLWELCVQPVDNEVKNCHKREV